MSRPNTSTSSPTGSTNLNTTLERLRAELDDRPGAIDAVAPILSHLTVGDLRAIEAAISSIHIPGHVELDWAEITDTPAEHWTVARYQAGRMFATERHYFVPAVTA